MSLATGDLTTISAVQGYLNSVPNATIITRLIHGASRMILSELNRDLLVPKDYVQNFNGSGTQQLVLPNWPLLTLNTLYISGASIGLAPESTTGTYTLPYGYRFQEWNGVPPGDPAVLELVGGAWFTRGLQNVAVAYRAGYQVTGEAQTIPDSVAYTIIPNMPYGQWATDEGVTYANGNALTAISSGSPLPGQYLPPDPSLSTPRNVYEFNAADASLGVLISYGYIPYDVEQVALDLIAERSAYRTRPGIRSQSLAGQEMISYDNSGFTSFIKKALAPYMNVLPPAMGASI